MRWSTRIDPGDPRASAPSYHLQLDSACLRRHNTQPCAVRRWLSPDQLLLNRHPRRVTRSQQMTSFSPSQLKSELTWFPSTTLPLWLTASASDSNDSSVGTRANGAVVCSWVFKSGTTHPKMKVIVEGQPFHYGSYRTAGREREICDRFLFPTAAKFAVKFVWRRTKHGGLVVQLPVRLVQTGTEKQTPAKMRWWTLLFHISNHSLKCLKYMVKGNIYAALAHLW